MQYACGNHPCTHVPNILASMQLADGGSMLCSDVVYMHATVMQQGGCLCVCVCVGGEGGLLFVFSLQRGCTEKAWQVLRCRVTN